MGPLQSWRLKRLLKAKRIVACKSTLTDKERLKLEALDNKIVALLYPHLDRILLSEDQKRRQAALAKEYLDESRS